MRNKLVHLLAIFLMVYIGIEVSSLSDDAIVEMSNKHASDQLQALLNGRRFDASDSEFSSLMMPNIGVCIWPEH